MKLEGTGLIDEEGRKAQHITAKTGDRGQTRLG